MGAAEGRIFSFYFFLAIVYHNMAQAVSQDRVISPSMDYHPVNYEHTSLRLKKIPLSQGYEATVTVPATSTIESQWHASK